MRILSFCLAALLSVPVCMSEDSKAPIDACTLLQQADVELILEESVVKAESGKSSSEYCAYRPTDLLNTKSGVMILGVARTVMKDQKNPSESDADIIERRIRALKTTLEVEKEEGLGATALWIPKLGHMMLLTRNESISINMVCADKQFGRKIANKVAKIVLGRL